MSRATAVPRVLVEVQGAPLKESLLASLVSVEVERAWDAPAFLSLRFADPPLDLHGEPVALGAELRVRIDDGVEPRELGVFDCTASRWDYGPTGDVALEVEGLDRLHRLARRSSGIGETSATLREALRKVTDGVVADIEGDVPLRNHPSVLQARGSDLDLVRRLCRGVARRFRLDGRDLRLHRSGDGGGLPVKLSLGEELLSLRVARSIEGQPGAVEARSWDPDAQEPRVATARKASRSDLGEPADGPSGSLRVHERPLPAVKAAELLAQGVLDRRRDRSLHLEGVCEGWCGVELGGRIELSGVARPQQGVYTVDRVLHRIDAAEGWVSRFEVGAPPAEDTPKSTPAPLVCSPAVVTQTRDPDQRGRVRVRYDALGEQLESDWLRVVHAGAGSRGGSFWTPHVGDEVLVVLESESLDAGYVLGGLYSRANPPGKEFEQAPRPKQGFRSRAGHHLLIDDDDDVLELKLDAGSRLRIRNGHVLLRSGGSVEVRDGHGNRLEMGRSKVRLVSDGALDLEAADKVHLAGGSVVISGSRIDFVKS